MKVIKKPKKQKLRNAEYYDLTESFDKLYEKSSSGKTFNNLMELITSEENIRLAYRNIKKNKGSKTAGADNKTICKRLLFVSKEPLENGYEKDLKSQQKILKKIMFIKPMVKVNKSDLLKTRRLYQ